MQSRTPVITTTDSIATAAQRMRDASTTFLPVCDAAERVVGVVTSGDIAVRGVAEGISPGEPVERIMTRQLIACRGSDELFAVHELMRRHHVSTIVCISERGELEGIIALRQLAREVDLRLAKTALAVMRHDRNAS